MKKIQRFQNFIAALVGSLLKPFDFGMRSQHAERDLLFGRFSTLNSKPLKCCVLFGAENKGKTMNNETG